MNTMEIYKNATAEAEKVHKYLDINSATILNSIADGVLVIDLNYNLLFVNRAAKEIFGKVGSDDFFINKKCDKVFGHSGCVFNCLINTTIKTGEHLYNHETTLERGGKKLVLSINTALPAQGACWKASCLAMSKGPLQARSWTGPEGSSLPMAGHYFSMRSAISPRIHR